MVVEGRARRQAGEERRDLRRHVELLAGAHHLPQLGGEARRRRFGGGGRQLLQGDERQEQPLDPLLGEQPRQRRRIAPRLLGDQDQGPTRAPGGEDLLAGDVERERGELQRPPAARRRGAELPVEHGGERGMGHCHSLGTAARARGIGDIDEVLGQRSRPERRRRQD